MWSNLLLSIHLFFYHIQHEYYTKDDQTQRKANLFPGNGKQNHQIPLIGIILERHKLGISAKSTDQK